MDQVNSFADQLSNAANEFWTSVGDYLPKILGALVLLIIALIVAKVLQALVERVLKTVGVEKLMKQKQVQKTLKTAEVNINLVDVAGRITFWVVLIIFGLAISDVLDLTAMSDVIREIINYLPNVLAAVIVLTVTVAGGRLVRDVVAASLSRMRVDFAHSVATFAYYVLLVFGTIMAIDQLGFATTLLTANLTIIVAGVVFALALAFGLGGRDTAGKVVEELYNNYKKPAKKR